MKDQLKQVRWVDCFQVAVVIAAFALSIVMIATRPNRWGMLPILNERIRLDEQLRVVRERYEHRQALPSSPSLNSLKSEGGE